MLIGILFYFSLKSFIGYFRFHIGNFWRIIGHFQLYSWLSRMSIFTFNSNFWPQFWVPKLDLIRRLTSATLDHFRQISDPFHYGPPYRAWIKWPSVPDMVRSNLSFGTFPKRLSRALSKVPIFWFGQLAQGYLKVITIIGAKLIQNWTIGDFKNYHRHRCHRLYLSGF